MAEEQCAAMGEMMGGMMSQLTGGGMMGGMMGGWGGLAWFGVLLLVIVGAAIAISVLLMRRPLGPVAEDPREILRRRFARGEIKAEEFADAMKVLA